MDDFDLKKLILLPSLKPKSRNNNAPPRHKQGEKFLKGPIPWNWLSIAGSLPGKALHVGLTIWFYSGLTGKDTIILSYSTLRKMGVKRNAVYRSIAALEEAGLVSVIRHKGRSPILTLMEVSGEEDPKDDMKHDLFGEEHFQNTNCLERKIANEKTTN